MISVCNNKWCKSHFEHEDSYIGRICPKCKSFDIELSDGVTWEEKTYEGSRFDNTPHLISIKVNNFNK